MAELLCADLATQTVREHLATWLSAARTLVAEGSYARAKLVLTTVLQAHPHCAEAHVLLVHTHLHLGRAMWPKALQVARHGLAACSSQQQQAPPAPQDLAACQLALGLALGSVARLTQVPQAERSQHRSEARRLLQAAAELQQPGSSGSSSSQHTVPCLYALALIDAEGGHYEQAVHHAQAALQAAEASGAPGGTVAPIVALIALLLSARQQLQAALSVVVAGLQNLLPSDRCDYGCVPAGATPAPAPTSSSSSSRRALPHCHDVLLLRVHAQLLLAVADANGALAVLGSARRRLANARRALELGADGGSPCADSADSAAHRLLTAHEAQVWRDLALAYASQQQPGDAQTCVAQMLALEPDSAASCHAQGAVAAACRDDVAAKAAYKAALALDADYAPALLSLGALLRRQGDVHDLSVAVGLLTDALRYEPGSHVGWLNLGLARKAQGHEDEGERHLFTAVTLAAAAPAISYKELPLALA